MRKIENKQLNMKKDWVVMELNHERYTFDIDVIIYENKSILEIIDDLCYNGLEKKIEKYDNQEVYKLDEIYHEDSDSDTWCLTETEKDRFRPLHIGAIMFMPLEDFLKEKYLSGCFGHTKRKYGVMDYAKYPVEMEAQKNEN